jgi:hypothetical protein
MMSDVTDCCVSSRSPFSLSLREDDWEVGCLLITVDVDYSVQCQMLVNIYFSCCG